MKHVYLEAYFCQNLGDDMFVRTLLREFADVCFHAEVPNVYSGAFLYENNLVIQDTKREGQILRKIAKVTNSVCYDAVVKIGGSIFMQKEHAESKCSRRPISRIIKQFAFRNRFVVGANFGPYFTDSFLELSRTDFSLHKGVCFRDSQSYALFKDLHNVKTAPDILFSYREYPPFQKGEGVGISVIKPSRKQFIDKYESRYYATLAQVCECLTMQGIPVTLYGFCDAEGDTEAICAIKAKMRNPEAVDSYVYDGDIEKMLSSLNSCEFVFASRFHAMILGFVMRKKVLPIIYSQKQTNVLDDLEYSGVVWDLLHGDFPNATDLVQACMENPVIEEYDLLRKQARGHFAQLRNYLS